jgi:hypothetical protein
MSIDFSRAQASAEYNGQQGASRMPQDGLINKGLMLKPGAAPTADVGLGRTFIISGAGRGGTTLVAKVLREAGMNLGKHIADVVGEDRWMLDVLRSGDPKRLNRVIRQRNAQNRDWGFKLPNIHNFIRLTDLARFRNPNLILIFRDPLAIAVRGALADYFDPVSTLRDTAAGLTALAEFAFGTTCPALLISYEKALIFPGAFVDALIGFCSLPVDVACRERMVDHVRPNATDYINGARRQYAGAVDLLMNGMLDGWACEIGELPPVALDLFVNERQMLTFTADRFRSDVLAAGYGNGNHGFSVDVSALVPKAGALLRVRISGRTFELQNSGRTASEYEPAKNIIN